MNFIFRPLEGGILLFILPTLFFILLVSCDKYDDITLKMTEEEVIQLLGEPDAIAIQEGKLLQKIEADDKESLLGKRFAYIYENDGIYIWFSDKKVAGMTKNGISVDLSQ